MWECEHLIVYDRDFAQHIAQCPLQDYTHMPKQIIEFIADPKTDTAPQIPARPPLKTCMWVDVPNTSAGYF